MPRETAGRSGTDCLRRSHCRRRRGFPARWKHGWSTNTKSTPLRCWWKYPTVTSPHRPRLNVMRVPRSLASLLEGVRLGAVHVPDEAEGKRFPIKIHHLGVSLNPDGGHQGCQSMHVVGERRGTTDLGATTITRCPRCSKGNGGETRPRPPDRLSCCTGRPPTRQRQCPSPSLPSPEVPRA